MPLPDDQPHTRTRLPVGDPGHGQPPVRQPRPLRTLLTVLVVVTLLVVAISIANSGSDGPSGTGGTQHPGAAPPAAATAATGQTPVTTTSNGIGTGYPDTEEGAQSAAANYAVALGGADMFRADGRGRILDTIADPAAVGGLRGVLDQAAGPAVLAGLGLDAHGNPPVDLTFVSRTVPIGSKTDTYAADTAKVDVWCAAMTGLAGQNSTKPVTASWFTFTISLHWTGGDWKVSDLSRQNGPVPLPADQQAATADQITGAVQQFGGFRYAR
ncbi:hypothetical protein [Kitasatospora viridis]|uniref:Uncharacterized protein n=1 Tax=Kitasatospora viridis TaxID=281105 RepID=A0A561UGK9_9ACTN|nr:hypothetical protein [Kitasatospora viridis]TWF98493.1 hypothetical protein FHX73_112302 [Kitasatospora viridis]